MKYVTKSAFYVAIARARKSLHILTVLQSGGATQPSSFIDHLPDEHMDFYKYKKSTRSKELMDGKQGFKEYLERLKKAASKK